MPKKNKKMDFSQTALSVVESLTGSKLGEPKIKYVTSIKDISKKKKGNSLNKSKK